MKPLKKQVFSNQFFRFCIFTANSRHIVSALFRRMHICHDMSLLCQEELTGQALLNGASSLLWPFLILVKYDHTAFRSEIFHSPLKSLL